MNPVRPKNSIFSGLARQWVGLFFLAIGICSGFSQTLNVPPRATNALTGSEFVKVITPMAAPGVGPERENWIYAQIISGNVPNFLRTLVPITTNAVINGTNHTITYYVTPDYLAIGTDADYFLEPTTPLLAQRLCDRLGYTLPTRKMVNDIWTKAAVKMAPQPIPPSADMITVPVFDQHNTMVLTQRVTFPQPLGALVGGDKKDVVIATKIYTNFSTSVTKPVVIYGWHYQNGSPIQPLYNGHEETYADYSHGIRFVQMNCTLDGAPNTITNILTNPNLAALLSDETTYANDLVPKPRYTVAAMAPVIVTQPASRAVKTNANVSLSVLAVGDLPMKFTWKLNGTAVSGATNSILSFLSVQLTNAGTYQVIVTNNSGAVTSTPAILKVSSVSFSAVFADDFDVDSSANWNLLWGSGNGVPDYKVDWSFDYSATSYTFNGTTYLIPRSPNSTGSTKGVKLTVNGNDTNGVVAGVNIYAKGRVFSNDFALKFDMWINYPGGAGGIGTGVTGSTQHGIFGINHLGTQANWAAGSAGSTDGIWFGASGEGGDSRDYRAYFGNLAGVQTELIGAGSGLSASDNASAIYQTLFSTSRFETAGAPGKNWVAVEVIQTNGNLIWKMNDTVIAQRANNSSFNKGTIMLGLMDVFPSVANPVEDSFVLFDNIRVEDLTGRPVVAIPGRTPDSFQFSVDGLTVASYVVDVSTNLLNWNPVQTSNPPFLYIESAATNLPQRFYRARRQS